MVLFGLTEAIMGKLHVVKVCKSGCTLNLNLFSSKQVLNLPPLQMHDTCPYNSQTHPIL